MGRYVKRAKMLLSLPIRPEKTGNVKMQGKTRRSYDSITHEINKNKNIFFFAQEKKSFKPIKNVQYNERKIIIEIIINFMIHLL
jgi:hypothetical protein